MAKEVNILKEKLRGEIMTSLGNFEGNKTLLKQVNRSSKNVAKAYLKALEKAQKAKEKAEKALQKKLAKVAKKEEKNAAKILKNERVKVWNADATTPAEE